MTFFPFNIIQIGLWVIYVSLSIYFLGAFNTGFELCTKLNGLFSMEYFDSAPAKHTKYFVPKSVLSKYSYFVKTTIIFPKTAVAGAHFEFNVLNMR